MTQLAPAAMALATSPEKRMPPSAITGTPVPSRASTASEMAVIWGHAHAGHDTGSTDGAGADTDLTALTPASTSALAPAPVATLPPMICRSG